MSDGGSGVFRFGPEVGDETMAALAEAVPGLAELGRGLGDAVFLTSAFVPFVLTLFSTLLPFWTAPFGVGDAPFVGVTDPPFIILFAGFGVFLSSMKGISATTGPRPLMLQPGRCDQWCECEGLPLWIWSAACRAHLPPRLLYSCVTH